MNMRKKKTKWRDCGVGFGDIPTVDFGFKLSSSKSRPSCHSSLSSRCATRCTRTPGRWYHLEQPSATFALYGDGANIKVQGQLWAIPCVFVFFCEFSFISLSESLSPH